MNDGCWGAYDSDGELRAVFDSKSEAKRYIRSRSPLHGGECRKLDDVMQAVAELLSACEVLDRQDERLQIASDEVWLAVQSRLSGRSKGGGGSPAVKPLMRLVYCPDCGGPMDTSMSGMKKGARRSDLASGTPCNTGGRGRSNDTRVREDAVLGALLQAMRTLIGDVDDVVEEVTREARAEIGQQRRNVSELRRRLAALKVEADNETDQLLRLMADPDMTPEAKRALVERLGGIQIEVDSLRSRVVEAAEIAVGRGKEIADMVHEVVRGIRNGLENAAPESLRELIAEAAGQMMLRHDGCLQPRELTGAEGNADPAGPARPKLVAEGRSLPLPLREAFWREFRPGKT
ncbi:MAG TPA: hypothetical protein PLP01_08955 [Phycisphaerae bacterium]|nr:hypothetical protein [Phycisphaerae bacterium]